MWPFSTGKNRNPKPILRSLRHRPRLEALEDRCLLSAPGTLDSTFGSGRLVTTNFAKKSFDACEFVAVQPDGKIIAEGIDSTGGHSFTLERYNTNGTLDTLFGMGGKVLTQFDSNFIGWTDQGGLVLQPDSKIAVAAAPNDGTPGYELARYKPNGTLDTSFGPNHNGTLRTDFGALEGLTIETVNGSPRGPGIVDSNDPQITSVAQMQICETDVSAD